MSFPVHCTNELQLMALGLSGGNGEHAVSPVEKAIARGHDSAIIPRQHMVADFAKERKQILRLA